MIPETKPYNNWDGNGQSRTFDFDFYIEDESQLAVYHTNKNGEQVQLVCGEDYDIHELKNNNGSYITFPIEGSSYEVLGEGEIISLCLTLPVSQENPYGKSSNFNLETLEYSLDYLTRLIQILYRQSERTVKVKEGSTLTPDELVENLYIAETKALGYMNTAQTLADEAAGSAHDAAQSAALAGEKVETIQGIYDDAASDIELARTSALTDIQEAHITATGDIESTRADAVQSVENAISDLDDKHSEYAQDLEDKHSDYVADFNLKRNSILTDIESTRADAVQSVEDAISDLDDKHSEYAQDLEDKHSIAVNEISLLRTSATNAITDIKDSAILEVNSIKTSAISSVNTTKTETLETIDSAKTAAINSVNSTCDSATSSINTLKTNALNAIETSGVDAVTSITNSETAALNNINSAKTSALTDINNSKTSALSDIEAAETLALTSVSDAQTSAISNIGTAETSAIENVTTSKADAVQYVLDEIAGQSDSALAAANQAVEDVNAAKAEIDNALEIISTGQIGMTWAEFSSEDWTQREDEKYYILVQDMPAVSCVYSKNGNKKTLVCGVDIEIDSENNARVISLNPFDGYVLGTPNLIEYNGGSLEDEDANEFTEEELQQATVSGWDDIN